MDIVHSLPNPNGAAPVRRPNSIRRTTILNLTWPAGRGGFIRVQGTGRDIYTTDRDLRFTTLCERALTLDVSPNRALIAAASTPTIDKLSKLIGTQCNGDIRRKIEIELNNEKSVADPLYMMLDDLPVSLIVSEWAWSAQKELMTSQKMSNRRKYLASLEGVCSGFRIGSGALSTDGGHQVEKAAVILSLRNPKDPDGWQDLPDFKETSFRRARLIEVWEEGGLLMIETIFQDSGTNPSGKRTAVHEYTVSLKIEKETQTIVAIEAVPHILPFIECPSALENLHRLIGKPVNGLRKTVPKTLPKTLGCTHLNDTLRSLEDCLKLSEALSKNIKEEIK